MSSNAYSTPPPVAALISSAQVCMPVDRLLTHRLRLEEINAGFDRLHEGKAIRQVVVF